MDNFSYRDFRAAVVIGVMDRTGWTHQESDNAVGDITESYDDAMTVAETVAEILVNEATE